MRNRFNNHKRLKNLNFRRNRIERKAKINNINDQEALQEIKFQVSGKEKRYE